MIKHDCEMCYRDPDVCYCSKHLEEIRKDAYDEGFTAGKESINE